MTINWAYYIITTLISSISLGLAIWSKIQSAKALKYAREREKIKQINTVKSLLIELSFLILKNYEISPIKTEWENKELFYIIRKTESKNKIEKINDTLKRILTELIKNDIIGTIEIELRMFIYQEEEYSKKEIYLIDNKERFDFEKEILKDLIKSYAYLKNLGFVIDYKKTINEYNEKGKEKLKYSFAAKK